MDNRIWSKAEIIEIDLGAAGFDKMELTDKISQEKLGKMNLFIEHAEVEKIALSSIGIDAKAESHQGVIFWRKKKLI